VPDAPLVNAGLDTTRQFFATAVNADPLAWLEYLKGIDFHKPIAAVTLQRHHALVRFDTLSSTRLTPFGYFTDPGVSPFHLGLSPSSYVFKTFTVVQPTPALVSTASSLSYGPSDRVSRIGGGKQYIISRADWPKLLTVSKLRRG
jgi:hypothetical protein